MCHCFDVDSTSVTETSDEPTADIPQQPDSSVASTFFSADSFEHSYVSYFYPNVTTLLSSVTFVHPTQEVETLRHISSPFCTLAIL